MCARPSHGAQFLAYVESLGIGKHAWVGRFLCRDHAGDFLPMLCANMSQWRIFSRTDQGVYGMRKLDEAEQNLRVLKAREQHT